MPRGYVIAFKFRLYLHSVVFSKENLFCFCLLLFELVFFWGGAHGLIEYE